MMKFRNIEIESFIQFINTGNDPLEIFEIFRKIFKFLGKKRRKLKGKESKDFKTA